jgi:hypothetical protein
MNTRNYSTALAVLAAGLTIAPVTVARAIPQDETAGKGSATLARAADGAGDLQGTWTWTTISSVGYRDTVTKQLAEPSGMSARFTFLPNGRYKYFFFVRQRTYSMVTEAATTEEGTVTFNPDAGTFTMKPTRGHYKGSTGSRLIDRDMTASERKPHVYRYEWREGDGGKKQLYIGPNADSLSLFKRADG